MRRLALLLQLLIALAMVLNGIGGAMAGVLVPGRTDMAAAVPGQAAAAGDDCTGHAAPVADGGRESPSGSGCHPGEKGPCDDGLHCLQACLHASVAVPAAAVFDLQPLPMAAVVRLPVREHPAPPLPDPIRPPIA